MGDEYEDVLKEGEWQKRFKVKPEVFTAEQKKAWLAQNTDVVLGSDAFFPFSDNIERAHKSGVKYIAQPGGSVRDDLVIECADKYGHGIYRNQIIPSLICQTCRRQILYL